MTTFAYTRLALCLQMMFCLAVLADFPKNVIPLTTSSISDFHAGMQYFKGDSETPVDGVQLVQRLTVDTRQYIIVTGNQVIFFLDTEKQQQDGGDLKINSKLMWNTKPDSCRGGYINKCYDHILIALPFDRPDIGRQLFICATGTWTNPSCRIYDALRNETTGKLSFNLYKKLHSAASRAYLPPLIHGKVTHLVSDENKLYTTSFMTENDWKPLYATNPLENLAMLDRRFARRTKEYKKIAETKDYVASHELSDRVLFFTNQKEKIHTDQSHRAIEVASICKNDPGYVPVGSTTYIQNVVKTRLECRELDIITGVSFPPKWQYEKEEDIIFYATFASGETKQRASAVCSFRVGDILKAFKGPFIDDTEISTSKDYNEKLSKVPNEHPGLCAALNITNGTVAWKNEKADHTLVQSHIRGKEIMTDDNKRFSSLVMRYDAGPYRNITMMYIGTQQGHVLRVLPPVQEQQTSRRSEKVVVIEQIDVFNKEECSDPNNSTNWIRDREVRILQLDAKTKKLQIGLRNCVIFKPIYSCSQFGCKSECIGSGDPECGWMSEKSYSPGMCTEYLTGGQGLIQNLTDAAKHPELYPACPIPTTLPPTTVAPATTGSLINLSSPVDDSLGSKTGNVKSAQTGAETMYIVLIVIVSIIAVMFLIFLVFLSVTRCSRSKEPVDFAQKQLRLQQSEMKHQNARPGGNSPSWMQRLLCKCDVWGFGWSAGSKRNSPIGGSPVMSYKEDRDTLINRSSVGQDYSETPTLPMVTRQGSQRHNQMAVRQEEARRSRHASSRHDSTSSVTSYRSHMNMEMKALGRTHSASGHSDIHCNSIPRSDPRAIPIYQTSSSSSSSRKDSPPVFHEHGAAECGVLPTASAKMRRRNERRASRVTNEIMRDSHDAVQQFENVYHSMIQNGFGSGTTPPHQHHLRQRLDSDDSGKGASPRNSLQNDMEQATVIDGRQVRPSSLHLGRPQQFRRTRLVSEPTYDIQMTPIRPGSIVKVAAGSPSRAYPQPQFIFAATSNKQPQVHPQDPRGSGMRGMPMRSHPSTPTNPNGGAFIPYQHQMATPQHQQQQQHHQQQQNSYPAYATLPKQQSAAMVTGQRPRTRHMSGNLPYQQVQMQPLLKDHQHPLQQAPPHMTSTTTSSSSNKLGGIPNRYPSMMVRGTHANIKSFQPRQGAQQHPHQQQRQHTVANTVMTTSAQAKNYYPSMPMQVAGESGKNDGSMEFKMVRRPDHLPVLVRQSSTSSSNGSSYHKGPVPAFETV